MTVRILYHPPDSRPTIEWAEDDGPLSIDEVRGLEGMPSRPILRRAPGQVGASSPDVETRERTVELSYELVGADDEHANTLRDLIERSLATIPGESAGVLEVRRDDGRPALQTTATPIDSPADTRRFTSTYQTGRADFICPSPLWTETADRSLVLELGIPNPWVSPWTSPWTSSAPRSIGDIDNPGHVPAGFRARFFGPQSGARLIHGPTGTQLAITGEIAAGQMVEVDTDSRTVSLDGALAMDRWDFTNGAWWPLSRGHQTIHATATSSEAGAETVILWRPYYAGTAL